jgi:hypothetical protein
VDAEFATVAASADAVRWDEEIMRTIDERWRDTTITPTESDSHWAWNPLTKFVIFVSDAVQFQSKEYSSESQTLGRQG